LTLHDHVAANSAKTNAQNAARDALLDAITKEVGKVDRIDAPNLRNDHLKVLAQAYALVVHGNQG
jgi:hypothetical protein